MSDPDANLLAHPPRSPRVEIGGLVLLARTIDKVRAKLAGTLGPYKIGPGLSRYLLEWLGISEADFGAAVAAAPDDAAVVAWVRTHSDPASYAGINERLRTRGLRDDAHRAAMLPLYPVLREQPALRNWFDILDLDDGEMFARAARLGGMAARFVTFSHHGGAARPGVLTGEHVRPFDPRVGSLQDFIGLEPDRQAVELARMDEPLALAALTLRAPVRPAKNIFCVGRNYLAHAAEAADARGVALDLPEVPHFFTKAPTSIADPDSVLPLPAVSEQYDWEAEVAVVIGRRCRDVAEADALETIFGYVCINDVTARDLQKRHGQWFKGKSLDASCPLGPWIVPAHAVGDPQALDVRLLVNGVVKQHASTSSMIFPIKRIIAELSRGLTLEPGDIIATGTPEGVGFARKPPEFLRDGDIVEVDVEKLGVLRNRIALRVAVSA